MSLDGQVAALDGLRELQDSVTYEYTYQGGTTIYKLDLLNMQSTNMDSNTARNLRWSAVLHWSAAAPPAA